MIDLKPSEIRPRNLLNNCLVNDADMDSGSRARPGRSPASGRLAGRQREARAAVGPTRSRLGPCFRPSNDRPSFARLAVFDRCDPARFL